MDLKAPYYRILAKPTEIKQQIKIIQTICTLSRGLSMCTLDTYVDINDNGDQKLIQSFTNQ